MVTKDQDLTLPATTARLVELAAEIMCDPAPDAPSSIR